MHIPTRATRFGVSTAAVAAMTVVGPAVAVQSPAQAASCYGILTGSPGSHSITYRASSGCLGQKMRAVVQCDWSGLTHRGPWAFYGSQSRASCGLWEGGMTWYVDEVAPGNAA